MCGRRRQRREWSGTHTQEKESERDGRWKETLSLSTVGLRRLGCWLLAPASRPPPNSTQSLSPSSFLLLPSSSLGTPPSSSSASPTSSSSSLSSLAPLAPPFERGGARGRLRIQTTNSLLLRHQLLQLPPLFSLLCPAVPRHCVAVLQFYRRKSHTDSGRLWVGGTDSEPICLCQRREGG